MAKYIYLATFFNYKNILYNNQLHILIPISKDFQEVLKYLDKNENATLNDLYDFVKLLKF